MTSMSFFPAMLIQLALFILPVVLMLVAKAWIAGRAGRLLASLAIAFAAGGVAFHAASAWGWKPILKGGHIADLSPGHLFWSVAGGHVAVLLFLVLPRDRDRRRAGSAGPVERERSGEAGSWRVGHQGRDCLYYEEYRGGRWERLEISGEMLMGPAHHVIYFAGPEQWQAYPEWARGRRDEIIARIKSRFAPPEYEYYGG